MLVLCEISAEIKDEVELAKTVAAAVEGGVPVSFARVFLSL